MRENRHHAKIALPELTAGDQKTNLLPCSTALSVLCTLVLSSYFVTQHEKGKMSSFVKFTNDENKTNY
jgi:hypothetical protein